MGQVKSAREVGEATALRLEQQIIMADCQVLAAIINFLHQDWGSYMKGGWVLRKAWKIYQRAYSQIRELYMKRVGLNTNTIGQLTGFFFTTLQKTQADKKHPQVFGHFFHFGKTQVNFCRKAAICSTGIRNTYLGSKIKILRFPRSFFRNL